jgi:hypothetical protein
MQSKRCNQNDVIKKTDISVYRLGRFGVLCVLVGVGLWFSESSPGVHVSLGKCQIMLDSFIYTVYIIKTSFIEPKGGKQWRK